jgi:hypothetical protein
MRATSSTMSYLFAMANISFDILRFFMKSLQIREESMSLFLKNKKIGLSSTLGMIFLLLQNHWMNTWRDSFFYTTLARSQSTPRCTHVVRKLLVNS